MEKIRNIKHTTALALLLATINGIGTTSCSNNKQEGHELLAEANSTRNDPVWESAHLSPKEELGEGISIIRDAGMAFYVVKKGDTLWKIWNKLKKTEEFSYLRNSSYQPSEKGRNIKGFNIPSHVLKPGFLLPIPLQDEKRITSLEEFRKWSVEAIEKLSEHEHYGPKLKELLKKIPKDDLSLIMCAFARSESAQDWKNFSDDIGSVGFHRWEPHMKAYSFSPYHILMEKNADGKTSGPGLKARLTLGLSEGQTYHPKHAGELFLAYWIEKTARNTEKMIQYFDISSLEKARKSGKIYNGSSKY